LALQIETQNLVIKLIGLAHWNLGEQNSVDHASAAIVKLAEGSAVSGTSRVDQQ
jgi:hypothetical protein